MRFKRSPYLAVLFLLLGGGSIINAQVVERIAVPDGVFYYQPASAVLGSEAAWVNPAVLGVLSKTGYQAMAEYYDQSFGKSWGLLGQREHLAAAYRVVDNGTARDYKEYLFAVGLAPQRQLSIGFSYRYFSDGPDYYRKLHSWTVALYSQQGRPFRWGAVWSNLNRSRVDGNRTEIEQRYSVAYRPFDEKLTVAVDMFLSTKTRLSHADFIYHAEIVPTPGVFINGYIDSDRNFEIGARVNLLHYFVGSKGRFARGGHERGTTVFGGWYSLRQPSPLKPPKKQLSMTLSAPLPENPPQPVFGRRVTPYATQLLSIYRAADDPSVRSMLVKIRGGSFGFAKAQELREAFSYLRSRGKRLLFYLSYPGNISYYLASIGDSIIIPPVCQVNLVGLRSELTFYGGTLEKLGVKIELLRIGDYKDAAEAYTGRESSDASRAQINRLLDDWSDQLVSGISDGRKITPDSVRRIIDNGPFTSVEARDGRLVDVLCYEDEIDSCLNLRGATPLAAYIADTVIATSWREKPVLAIVVADGEITSDGGDISPAGRPGEVTPGWMDVGLKRAQYDPQVKGIVLRINSPGGSALASDDILHSIQKASVRKPMVVSMGNLAASGGYYIATSAQRIFAMPATTTGSIGIFGGKADYSGLHQKIALGKELYTRGRFAGMMTTIRPFTDEERQKYFGQLKAFYGRFVSLVGNNRKMSTEAVDSLGQGQVWTGHEALANGLVDEAGGLKQALDFLARTRKLKSYSVAVFPQRRPLFIWPSPSLLSLIGGFFGVHEQAKEADEIGRVLRIADDALIARLPYDIVVE
jgi:protease-4